MKEILARIDRRHAKLKTTDASASRAATGSPDLIRNWRRAAKDGKNPGASTSTLAKLADALRTNFLWLADGQGNEDETAAPDKPLRFVTVAAHVQAGVFSESWEWQEEDQYQVAVPTDEEVLPFRLYAAETRGPSMNRRWPEGTVVIFTNVAETLESPIPGKRYIVERRRMGGDAEHTVKKLVRDDHGKLWLMPESDDPRFQTAISVDEGTGDEDTVSILGRVWYSVARE